jgi:hypothetical protein
VFSTADELVDGLAEVAREHSEVASLRRVGTSRLGDPLMSLTVGTGNADAVVFGLAHPSEPIGGPSAVERACAHRQDRDCFAPTALPRHRTS